MQDGCKDEFKTCSEAMHVKRQEAIKHAGCDVRGIKTEDELISRCQEDQR